MKYEINKRMKIRISFFCISCFSLQLETWNLKQENQDIVRQIRFFRESVPFR
jgi:hypothetical protein